MSASPQIQSAEPPLPPPIVERARVLVVDDEPQALRVFSAFLSASGMDVVAIDSGAKALEMVSPGRYEAVVTDLRMPGVDGFSLLKGVRERDADLPVVVVSGCPEAEAPSAALDLGAIEFLVKPVAAEVLVRTVETSARLCRLARCARSAGVPPPSVSIPLPGPALPAALARAMESLYLAWQPIVHASGGGRFGMEAFARTLEPSLSAPHALFDAADRLGRSRALGRLCRRAVAAVLPRPGGALAFVNVHPSDLGDDELLDPSSPLSLEARSVVLEVTNRTPLEDVTNVRGRIRALRDLGYRIGVDDVRSGGASLQRLALVEPDFAKLNPSLVRGLAADDGRRHSVALMTASLHDLGIRVVATGVETAEEREAAVACGVDHLQGFLFGRPKPLP